MNRRLLWWVVGLVGAGLVVALLVALTVGGGRAGVTTTTTVSAGSEYGVVTVEGETLSRFQGQPATDQEVGASAPEVSGEDFNGEPVAIAADGRPKVILFLAHWCPHCQAEVPRVQDWVDQTGGNPEVDLYSVATSTSADRPNYPPSAWLEGEGWTAPVLVDDQAYTAASAYGLNAFPYWVGIDGASRVMIRLAGELNDEGIQQLFDLVAQSGGY